jgi:integrase
MAWIERASGGWVVRWWTAGRGSAKGKSEVYPNQDMAKREKKRIAVQLDARAPLGDHLRLLPWNEVVQRWHDTRPAGRYRTTASEAMNRLPWKTVRDATPAALRAFNVFNLRIVRSVLFYAQSDCDQPVDPRLLLVTPAPRKRKPEKALYDDAKVQSLVDACAATAQGTGALAHMLATYGHRAENLVRLTCSAVNLDQGTITLTVKGGDEVQHPLTMQTLELLRPLIHRRGAGPAAPLFPNHLGVAWSTGQEFASWFHGIHKVGYYQAFKRWAISRMLRPTTAGGLGLDAKTVAAITGHRTVSLLLNTYARTSEPLKAAAIAALSAVAVPPRCPGNQTDDDFPESINPS